MTALLLAWLLTQTPDETTAEEPPKLNVLSVELDSWMANGMDMGRGSTAISFERALVPHLSLAVGLVTEARSFWPVFSNPVADVREYAGGIRASARYYPQGNAPFGLWLGAMAGGSVSADDEAAAVQFVAPPADRTLHATVDARVLTAGALVGISATIGFGVVFQVSGGVRADWMAAKATILNQDGSTSNIQVNWVAVSPTALLGAGWAF